MQDKIDALLKKLVNVPVMTVDQYLAQIDAMILKSEHNFSVYNELLLIAEDNLADCNFDYERLLARKIVDNLAGGSASSTVEKVSKAEIANSAERQAVHNAEKLSREFKVRKENADSRHNAFKKIKGGMFEK